MSDPRHADITLGGLLARRALALRLVVPAEGTEASRIDVALDGIHPSDLLDPTPFLTPGLALLTTGTQFADTPDDSALYRDYVMRLVDHGVVALGFGTDVVRHGVPPLLATACADAGLVLFEVPYDTPFLAVTRAHAEARAARAAAGRVWALDAQRALSLAALQPDGLDRIVAELASRLDTWVCLFDASGTVRSTHGIPSPPEAVAGAARTLLRRGGQASFVAHSAEHDTAVTLHTLGSTGRLRGVLAIADDEHAHETRGVMTAVVALAGLALEQRDSLDAAAAMLRRGTMQSALAGGVALASRVARAAWGAWPSAPIVVGVAEPGRAARGALLGSLERLAEARPVFFADLADGVAIMVGADDAEGRRRITQLAADHEIGIGLSEAVTWDRVASALAHARHALARGGAHAGIHSYTELARHGRLGVRRLAAGNEAARAEAEAALAPLVLHDERTGGELVATLRAWFAADCRIELAASRLRVHRHTVRARLATAADVLERDLTSFADRAELWVALEIDTAE